MSTRAGGKPAGAVVFAIVLAFFSGVAELSAADVTWFVTPLPYTIDGVPAGEFETRLRAEDSVPFAVSVEFIDVLRTAVTARLFREISGAGEFVTFEFLRFRGIDVNFDPARLVVEIRIPVEDRLGETVRYRAEYTAPRTAVLSPVEFSAYMNISARIEQRVDSDGLGGASLSYPVYATVEPVFNFRRWVFESFVTFDSLVEPMFSLGSIRVVRDFPELATRLSVGRVVPATGAFHSAQPVYGGSYERAFVVDPTRHHRPDGTVDVVLPEPGRVTVFVNDRELKTVFLDAGRHSLTGIPLFGGVNDVRVTITDASGSRDLERRTFAYDSALLARGESTFGATLGANAVGEVYPVATGSFRFGLTDAITLGAAVQARENRGVGSADFAVATPIGNLRSELAMSLSEGLGPGGAVALSYSYRNPGIRFIPALAARAVYRSESFAPVGATGDNPQEWVVSATATQLIASRLTAGVNVERTVFRADRPDATRIGLTSSASLGRGASLVLAGSLNWADAGPAVPSASLSFVSTPTGTRQTFSASHDLVDGRSTVAYSSAQTGASPVGYSATITGLPFGLHDDYGLGGTVRYNGYRIEGAVSHSSTVRDDATSLHRSTIRVASAVAFADGTFVTSSPIRDSFVVVAPGAALSGEVIGINPGIEGPVALADRWGAGVLPALRSYRYHPITLEFPILDEGYDAGNGSFWVYPTYRSAVVIRPDLVVSIRATGVLADATGRPITLAVAEAVRRDDPEAVAVQFFTDYDGRFELYGLAAGTYDVRLLLRPESTGTLSVPADEFPAFDAGTVVISDGREDE